MVSNEKQFMESIQQGNRHSFPALAVIIAIAILAGFQLPALSKEKEKNQRIDNEDNLKQTSTAHLMSSNENKGFFQNVADNGADLDILATGGYLNDEIAVINSTQDHLSAVGNEYIDEDGQNVDQANYVINTTALLMTKSANALWDPINFGSNPKVIPGGYIRYSLKITHDNIEVNDAAQLKMITNVLDENTDLDPDLINGVSVLREDPNGAGDVDTEKGSLPAGFSVQIRVPTGGTNTRSSTIPAGGLNDPGDVLDLDCLGLLVDGCDYTGKTLTLDMEFIFPAEPGYGNGSAGDLAIGESIEIIYNTIVR